MKLQKGLNHLSGVIGVRWRWHSICSGEGHHGELLVHHFIHLHAHKMMHESSRKCMWCNGAAKGKRWNDGAGTYRKKEIKGEKQVDEVYLTSVLWCRWTLSRQISLWGMRMVLILCPVSVTVCIYLYPDDYPVWFQGCTVFLKAICPWWHPCGLKCITLMQHCGVHFLKSYIQM